MDNLEKLKVSLGPNCYQNVSLAKYTTLNIGGPASLFIEVQTEEQLKDVISSAMKFNFPFLLVGAGSNLLVCDEGFSGLVIKNALDQIKIEGNKIRALSGTLLQTLVDEANSKGLRGFESLAGIPGTVGGAIYGNAGAYGQSISDKLTSILVFDGKKDVKLSKGECEFNYRDSVFKKNKSLQIIEAEFELEKGDPTELESFSNDIVKTRNAKYPPSIKCPGSFFKNVVASSLDESVISKIDTSKITHGKIPAGHLLEEVGAKGAKQGEIEIAEYHANLFLNKGEGTAKDFWQLAQNYKDKVKDKFGITLEPEVQLVGFNESF